MDTHGIGVDDEISRGRTEAHKSVLLLEPTEQQTEEDTDDGDALEIIELDDDDDIDDESNEDDGT